MGADGNRMRQVPAAAFRPPALPVDCVGRPDLERRLGAPRAAGVSLVTGPPGYGKTTTVRQWLETLDSPWAWINLDPVISRPDLFWRGVVRAVQTAAPDRTLDAIDAVSVDAVDPSDVVRTLVEDLDANRSPTRPIVLVIDDAHLLEPGVWRDLEWLIAHQPPLLHLVLCSRADPPFSVARLRSLGRLSEVRHRDLGMSLTDTMEMVRRWGGDHDNADVAAAVFERTEGWPAGIRLALLALGSGASAADVLGTDVGSRAVAEFLLAEALDRQPEDVREFLRKTSVAGVLTPALCEALTGRTDSRSLLQSLARLQLFITPVDGGADQYRYHPLFAEVLRLELRSTAPDAEAVQHRRAAEWYAAQGQFARAIEHARAGSDYDLVLGLIVSHLPELGATGHRQAVGRWVLDVPARALNADADRLVRQCEALLYLGRTEEWLATWRRADVLVGADRPDLRRRLDLFQTFFDAGRGDLEAFEAKLSAIRASRPAGVDDPFDEVADAWLARLLMLNGRLDEAVAAAEAMYRRPRVVLHDITARSLLAATLATRGDFEGPALVREAIAMWRAQGEPDMLGMVDALGVGALRALDSGDLDEAELLASAGVAVSSTRPTHVLGALAEVVMARVERALGRGAEAAGRLDDLHRRMAEHDAAPVVLDVIAAARDDGSPSPAPSARGAPQLVDELTDREITILGYLAGHLTFPEIGRELFISRHTVKTHVARIYRKLDVTGRSGAVDAARSLGLLT